MADPRIEAYARVLVERCLDVQPGMQVLVRSTPLARALLDELSRQIARRGAYVVQRIHLGMLWPVNDAWAAEAPEELVRELCAIDRFAVESMDARITVDAPENTRAGMDLSPERRTMLDEATHPFYRRTMAEEIPWVGCQYPTPALAQEAGMTLAQFEDFLYGCCLVDWDVLNREMRRLCDRFDAAHEVRIVDAGNGTDLRLSLEGRKGAVDTEWLHNMPSGEFFFAPVEDSAEGVIEFDFPTDYRGQPVEGVRLVLRDGLVVDASARTGEDALHSVLDTDAGSRRLGELGIGCNPGVTRHMRNTLFDEKMAGTIHLAVGAGYPKVGGVNVSAVHWDIVKDLRRGGELYLDGELVQRAGAWLL